MYLFTEHAREDYQMFRYLNDTDSKSAGLADYDMEDILKLKVIIGNFYVHGDYYYGQIHNYKIEKRILTVETGGYFKVKKSEIELDSNNKLKLTLEDALKFKFEIGEKIKFDKYYVDDNCLLNINVVEEKEGSIYMVFLDYSFRCLRYDSISSNDRIISKRKGNIMLEKAKTFNEGDFVKLQSKSKIRKIGAILNQYGTSRSSFTDFLESLKSKDIWEIIRITNHIITIKHTVTGNSYDLNSLSIGDKLTAKEIKKLKEEILISRIKKRFEETYQTSRRHNEQEMSESLRKYFRMIRENHLLDARKKDDEKDYFMKFLDSFEIKDRLDKHSLIKSFEIDTSDFIIRVNTKALEIEESNEDDFIGEFSGMFCFHLNCLKNEHYIYSNLDSSLMIHPHVSERGVPCWGNLWPNFEEAIKNLDWMTAIECMFSLVQSINEGDTYWELLDRNDEYANEIEVF